MNNRDLKKLTKSQLIKLLLKKEKQTANEFENSIVSPPKQEESLPGKSVNNYKDLIIEPPEQFQDRQRPPKPTRKPPLPPTPKDHFNFDDDISKPITKALKNSKSLAYKADKTRISKVSRMNSKLKSLKNWMMLKKYVAYFKN